MRVLCRSHFTFRGVRWRNIPKSEIDLHGGRRVVSRYIYVVDDDDQVRESLGFVLKMAGFQPVLFESGTKFLEEMDGLTPGCVLLDVRMPGVRSEEHTSELQSLMRISYAVFCLKKKNLIH